VAPAPLARLVGRDLGLGFDANLLADKGLHARRRLAHIVEKRAQEAHGAELYGDPEPHVVAAPRADEHLVGVVEMEIARKVLGRRVTAEATITALLFLSQEAYGHEKDTEKFW
jgi:hypothetical protein